MDRRIKIYTVGEFDYGKKFSHLWLDDLREDWWVLVPLQTF